MPKLTDEECPICKEKMLIRESRFGKYLSCGKFPKCKGKIQLDEDGNKVVPETTDEICEVCDKGMVIRTGRKGRFLACSGYPDCRPEYLQAYEAMANLATKAGVEGEREGRSVVRGCERGLAHRRHRLPGGR